MSENHDCRISNPSESLLVSDILKHLLELSENQNCKPSVIEKKSVPEAKGEIITGILLGIASSAAYDFIKIILKRLLNRKDYDPTLTITIDNVVVSLEDLTKK